VGLCVDLPWCDTSAVVPQPLPPRRDDDMDKDDDLEGPSPTKEAWEAMGQATRPGNRSG
jgi:hypothetical protein